MKRKLDIDWSKVMDDQGGEVEPPDLEIVAAAKVGASPKLTERASGGRCGDWLPADDQVECEQSLTDREINNQIARQKTSLVKFGRILPDKGEKIRAKIKRLEEEKQRRILRRPQMDVEEWEKPTHSTTAGRLDHPQRDNAASKGVSRSTFAACFSKKPETGSQSVKPFDNELHSLGCEIRTSKFYGEMSKRQRQGSQSPSRRSQFQYNRKTSAGGYKNTLLNGDLNPKGVSPYSLCDDEDEDEIISHNTPRGSDLKVSPSYGTRHQKRPGQDVIHVDEEEAQCVTLTRLVAELPEGLKEDIYYPSRDDPDFVQVCCKDMECLSPEGYLTSPIMNFYIKYLQQQASATNQVVSDCHFFNTYFYKKLKEAVLYKGNDKDAFFLKFRRWWKGINLFRKAYILIPIHEDAHWSLVIICIPDKEDGLGPVILHLDSLRFHCGISIFDNVKRFLKEEWNYLNQDGATLDLPFSDKIWYNLRHRISDKQIEVPQQKNDYDCGLFVLFFMERFIQMAPERLKRNDLEMFGRKWFKPAEASALRVKILNILIDLFKRSSSEDEET